MVTGPVTPIAPVITSVLAAAAAALAGVASGDMSFSEGWDSIWSLNASYQSKYPAPWEGESEGRLLDADILTLANTGVMDWYLSSQLDWSKENDPDAHASLLAIVEVARQAWESKAVVEDNSAIPVIDDNGIIDGSKLDSSHFKRVLSPQYADKWTWIMNTSTYDALSTHYSVEPQVANWLWATESAFNNNDQELFLYRASVAIWFMDHAEKYSDVAPWEGASQLEGSIIPFSPRNPRLVNEAGIPLDQLTAAGGEIISSSDLSVEQLAILRQIEQLSASEALVYTVNDAAKVDLGSSPAEWMAIVEQLRSEGVGHHEMDYNLKSGANWKLFISPKTVSPNVKYLPWIAKSWNVSQIVNPSNYEAVKRVLPYLPTDPIGFMSGVVTLLSHAELTRDGLISISLLRAAPDMIANKRFRDALVAEVSDENKQRLYWDHVKKALAPHIDQEVLNELMASLVQVEGHNIQIKIPKPEGEGRKLPKPLFIPGIDWEWITLPDLPDGSLPDILIEEFEESDEFIEMHGECANKIMNWLIDGLPTNKGFPSVRKECLKQWESFATGFSQRHAKDGNTRRTSETI
jgi:hypothetical protein